MKKLVVKKNGTGDFAFEVDDPTLPGSPIVGRGSSIQHALGDWMIHNQASLGIFVEVDSSVYQNTQKEQAKYPDDGGLKEQMKNFEDAYSGFKMLVETFGSIKKK